MGSFRPIQRHGRPATACVHYAWPNAPAAYLENTAGQLASTFTSEEQLTSPCLATFQAGARSDFNANIPGFRYRRIDY